MWETIDSQHPESQSSPRKKSSQPKIKGARIGISPVSVPKPSLVSRNYDPSNPMYYMPKFMRPYIEGIVDVIGDGHCGFRAIAECVGLTEESHAMVRRTLIKELKEHRNKYIENRPVVEMTTLDIGVSETFSPLRGVPPVNPKSNMICLGLIPNHFVILSLKDGCPLPPSSTEWRNHRSDEAKTWDYEFLDQHDRFRALMEILDKERPQEFDFGERVTGTRSDTVSHKRSSAEFDDGNFDNDPYGKKAKTTAEVEAASGVTTGMILSLRESLQDCKETLDSCLNELEDAQYEIQNWRSAFQNAPFIPAGTAPVPKLVINYLQALKSSVESLADQLEKAKKKEVAFIVTFAKREQEIAKLKSAVRDLKAQLKPTSMQARRFLLDPVIHEEFTRLKNLVAEKDTRLKELQDQMSAVKFTSQSKMGKLLMAKCKTLQEENEEIGLQASEGKMHELAMKLSLQKDQNSELRNQFEELQKHMDGLTNDVERSNETVFMLQGKVDEKDLEIERLKDELQQKKLRREQESNAGD
ncbi:FKBP12-interacting protein of 37 kDa-like protein, putative [Medicago truncatula]|uniref:FKBP12-interacting protein of 37 kDa-like protein, putative n=1 Tax=Medicago truncatula TaxID=3880 RepID=A0A072TRA5_MEDTR|nr:FKBP12-interacting protein of 37 kDa-like protein, putative [Medicago truncatula]